MIIDGLKEAGINFVTCLPESLLRPLYTMLDNDPYFEVVYVTNEGEGASIAAGAWLGGKKPILIMENSGIRTSVEALSRLGLSYGIPVLMLMCHRGAVGESTYWGIAHGLTMQPILEAVRIPYVMVRKEEEIKKAIRRGIKHIYSSMYHVAIILSNDITEVEN